ncbi:MAG: hypothetical protein ACOYJE_08325 [Bacteroidaceae bacterium]|jgi:hypothetical protein
MKTTSLYVLFMLLLGLNAWAQEGKVVLVPDFSDAEGIEVCIGRKQKGLMNMPVLWDLLGRGTEDSIFFYPSRTRPMVEGGAFYFRVLHYETEAFGQDTAFFRSTGTSSVLLDVVDCWEVSALAEEAGKSRKKFGRTDFSVVLGNLTDGKFRTEPAKLYGYGPADMTYSGLIRYSYDGKPCFLLWDDLWKLTITYLPGEFSRTGRREKVRHLPSRFENAEQMLLCRYSENCYVLLLLTQPMVEMD